MNYIKSKAYDTPEINARVMGPNPIKLTEELMTLYAPPRGSVVMDLGSGQGVTSVFLAREYGLRVFAADLWSDPTDNLRFFESLGLRAGELVPIHADAMALPFARGFFDAVISTDSYNYFGREPDYLGEKLLPFVKPGGYVSICVPGMKKDLHDALPPELLLSWTPEQLDYLHDADYWRAMVSQTPEAEIIAVQEMESNEEVWADWLKCDNEYARADRAAIEAGGGKYLNFVALLLRRRAG